MSDISEESYQKLKKILEEQNHVTYTIEEIHEIGGGLIDFFTLLIELENEDRDLGTDE